MEIQQIDNCWSTCWFLRIQLCWSTVDQLLVHKSTNSSIVDQHFGPNQQNRQKLINLLIGFRWGTTKLINICQQNSTFGLKIQLFRRLLINFSPKINLLINSWSTSWTTKVDQLLINKLNSWEINKLINSWSTCWFLLRKFNKVDQQLINFYQLFPLWRTIHLVCSMLLSFKGETIIFFNYFVNSRVRTSRNWMDLYCWVTPGKLDGFVLQGPPRILCWIIAGSRSGNWMDLYSWVPPASYTGATNARRDKRSKPWKDK